MCYVPPSIELLGPTTPVFKPGSTTTPVIWRNLSEYVMSREIVGLLYVNV